MVAYGVRRLVNPYGPTVFWSGLTTRLVRWYSSNVKKLTARAGEKPRERFFFWTDLFRR